MMIRGASLFLPFLSAVAMQHPIITSSVEITRGQEPFPLYYELHGTGDHKVMLITGLGGTHSNWYLTVHHLMSLQTANYQVCTLDNRGAGRSGLPTKKRWTTTEMAHDVLNLIDHIQWTDVHVVGISMGGMIAQELSFLLGKRLKSLSLLVTHAGGVNALAPVEGLRLMMTSYRQNTPEKKAPFSMQLLYSKRYLEQKVPAGTSIHQIQRYMPPLEEDSGRTVFDVLAEDYIRRVAVDGMPKGFVHQVKAVATHYLSDVRLKSLKALGAPILVIAAQSDVLVRPINSVILRDALQPNEYLDLGDCGHGVIIEAKDEVNNALVRNFERAISSSSGDSSSTSL